MNNYETLAIHKSERAIREDKMRRVALKKVVQGKSKRQNVVMQVLTSLIRG